MNPRERLRTAAACDAALIERVRGEYLEMPGLRLTPAQAARLLAIDQEMSRDFLQKLAEEGFLRLTVDGAYVRNSNA